MPVKQTHPSAGPSPLSPDFPPDLPPGKMPGLSPAHCSSQVHITARPAPLGGVMQAGPSAAALLRGGRGPCVGPSCRTHMETGHLRGSAHPGSVLAHQNLPQPPEPLSVPLLSGRQQRSRVPVQRPRLSGLQFCLPGRLLEGTLLGGKIPPLVSPRPHPRPPSALPRSVLCSSGREGRLKSWPPRVYCAQLSEGRAQPGNEFPDPASLASLVSVASRLGTAPPRSCGLVPVEQVRSVWKY